MIDTKTLEEKVRNLECPFCKKPRKYRRVWELVVHVNRCHFFDECPLCGKKYKDLVQHYAKSNDKGHLILYALYGSFGKGKHKRSEKLKKIRDELWG